MLKRRQQQYDIEDVLNINEYKDNNIEIIKEHKINYKTILFVIFFILSLFLYLNYNNKNILNNLNNNNNNNEINKSITGTTITTTNRIINEIIKQQEEKESQQQLIQQQQQQEKENIKLKELKNNIKINELLKEENEHEEIEKYQKEELQRYEEEPPQIGQPVPLDIETLLSYSIEAIDRLREFKQKGRIIETDFESQVFIPQAQNFIRQFLESKYGRDPYYVAMELEFPQSMQSNNLPSIETIIIELAPIEYVPYSVYFFLENIIKNFQGGKFHRNAGHVLQAMLQDGKPIETFAWQEYSPKFPHQKFTLGYAGRPSSSKAIYISTVDNTHNHGPGSQGSKTEADSCFGKIYKGFDIVKRMQSQPGASPGAGWIEDKNNYINIKSLKLITPDEFM